FGVNDLFDGLESGIWENLGKESDVFQRNLQKTYVRQLVQLLSPPKEERNSFGRVNTDPTESDISSIARGQLSELLEAIRAAKNQAESVTKYHLADLEYRIIDAL